MAKSGIARGLNAGHVVTPKARPFSQARRKGYLSKRVKVVREIVREVAGLAPYERRLVELLKLGKDKRALKLAKKKLGTHLRGKAKREEMAGVIRAQRATQKGE
eukprot:CAMPEP_0119131216 /NCGR_PEP_ID=MMETSP1310-20130426/9761_1 /TAXON_ID=464262 /ORGANISM="Genus nov. species nov., Strain RCC2339" /LENGTH=103 /DNA_ID=CAMNT_0007121771 /DNA_START=25 /DNA_END=336 /DNA_ORIENTATION=+